MPPTSPLTVHDWQRQGGPDYGAVFRWRMEQLELFRNHPVFLTGAIEYYKHHPVEFISDWLTTFDPRNAGKPGKLTLMPFVLFEKQAEFVRFIDWCRTTEHNGIAPKSRDMGVTWTACGYSVWAWRFIDGASIGWGSRKEQLVDKLGVIDSIFEKIRILIRWLPKEFIPIGYSEKNHANYMRITNPQNGNVISGEAGDNIGRGGRNLIYFKDESAHYERPEMIEAALSANTRVQIDISSVSAPGTVFHRKHDASIEWTGPDSDIPRDKTACFTISWKDHPEKTQEWYDTEKNRMTGEGLGHLFAQEVDIDYYSAATNRVILIEWIEASIDAHEKLGIELSDNHLAGLDVADGGIDLSAFVARQDILLFFADQWPETIDPGKGARKAVGHIREFGKPTNLQYDSIGVGAAVKTELNRLDELKQLPDGLIVNGWNAGAKVRKPHARIIEGDEKAPKNVDFFYNWKAQATWNLRSRFFKTFKYVTEGIVYPHDELISISSKLKLLDTLKKELTQLEYGYSPNMKLLINKQPDGTRSPNLADGVIMCYNPVDNASAKPVFGTTSGT